jgi:four helix bundle protein
MSVVKEFRELRVYKSAFEGAMRIFEISKKWPSEERYSLTDQIRRSSRSVCGNIAEAWRKRRYVASFVHKLSDSDAESAETETWLDFAMACGYIEQNTHDELYSSYENIIGGLVKMMADPESWCGPSSLREEQSSYETDSDE